METGELGSPCEHEAEHDNPEEQRATVDVAISHHLHHERDHPLTDHPGSQSEDDDLYTRRCRRGQRHTFGGPRSDDGREDHEHRHIRQEGGGHQDVRDPGVQDLEVDQDPRLGGE